MKQLSYPNGSNKPIRFNPNKRIIYSPESIRQTHLVELMAQRGATDNCISVRTGLTKGAINYRLRTAVIEGRIPAHPRYLYRNGLSEFASAIDNRLEEIAGAKLMKHLEKYLLKR